MMIQEAKQKLANCCNSQVGYHESWDGTNKYGADGDWDERLYGFEASNVPWCFTANTLILTDNGYKYIQDIDIGDRLLSANGERFNKVTKISVHDSIVKDYRVYGAIPFSVTPDHPFLSQIRVDKWHRNHGFKDWGYHSIVKLHNGDMIASPVTPVLYEDYLSYDELWIVGYYVGDGHCSRRNDYVLSANEEKAEKVNRHTEGLGYWDKDYKSRSCKQFNLKISTCSYLKPVLDDCGHLAYNKRVPRQVLFGTKEAKRAFLDGYFSADGCSNLHNFNSVSSELVTGLIRILFDVGIACSINPQKRPPQGKIWDKRLNAYRTFNQREIIYNCSLSVTEDAARQDAIFDERFTFLPLRKIGEDTRVDTVYTITTDGDHSYTANNLGVHNCDVFADYAYIHNFGYDEAVKMTFQDKGGSALCRRSAELYQNNGHWSGIPEVGDQVFFYYGGEINHTGIVVAVNGDNITCVEGNCADSVGRTYYNWRISNQIAGFGHPDWSVVVDEPEEEQTENEPEPTSEPDLVRAYPMLMYGEGVNRPKPIVKAWQNLLLAWGFNLDPWGADGEFGATTQEVTIAFQKKVGIKADGIVGEESWKQAIYLGE